MPLFGDAKRAHQREWLRKRRQDWLDVNGPCVMCGSSQDLEVDHVDPTTKLYRVSTLWSLSPTNPKRVVELAKCQVLCGACHSKKTALQAFNTRKPYIHGTKQAYERGGCRCDACREWRRKSHQERYWGYTG